MGNSSVVALIFIAVGTGKLSASRVRSDLFVSIHFVQTCPNDEVMEIAVVCARIKDCIPGLRTGLTLHHTKHISGILSHHIISASVHGIMF